jgi:hypothetical protein
MSMCKHLKVCAFYNNRLSGIPNEGAFFKQLYCMNKSEKCARLKMSAERDVSDSNNMTNPLGMEYGKEKMA